jgi:hypothetical protein
VSTKEQDRVCNRLASCSDERSEYTEQERVCITQRYTNYDANRLSQMCRCVQSCRNGTIVTCNTSCKLKGAS